VSAEALAAALAETLESLVRRVVREETRRHEHEWRWRTPAQAGELLGISAAAVRQRVVRGQLPARRLEGRVYLDINNLDVAIKNGSYDARPQHLIDKWAERCSNTPGPDDQGGTP
jgi:hypothetical protein